jgi:hypothetical protein
MFGASISISCGRPKATKKQEWFRSGINPWLEADEQQSCDKIDSSHKLPVRKKTKNVAGKTKEPETES